VVVLSAAVDLELVSEPPHAITKQIAANTAVVRIRFFIMSYFLIENSVDSLIEGPFDLRYNVTAAIFKHL
jgi:hypothetical protein